MTETYPSDNELLNMQSDTETGVEFIATGQAPYYLQFRKLLYRLLLAAKRSNDLRVYDEGGLNIGVKAGKFWLGTQLVSVEGSSGNTLADNKDNIYVYLDSNGNLITNEYSGFPEMAATAHVRLAVVTTSNGDIESITDVRCGHNIFIPYGGGGVKKTIEPHTANDTLTIAESDSIHTNFGATGTIVITLPPSSPEGVVFTFAVQAAQQLRVDPGAAAIRDSSGQTPHKYKSAQTIGSCIMLASDENGDWVTIAKSGTWTEEA